MENSGINNTCLELWAILSITMKSSTLLLSHPEHESSLCLSRASTLHCMYVQEKQGVAKCWYYLQFQASTGGIGACSPQTRRQLYLLVIEIAYWLLCVFYSHSEVELS